MPGGDRWFASVPVHDRRLARECGPGRRAGVASEVVELVRGAVTPCAGVIGREYGPFHVKVGHESRRK